MNTDKQHASLGQFKASPFTTSTTTSPSLNGVVKKMCFETVPPPFHPPRGLASREIYKYRPSHIRHRAKHNF